MTTKDLRKEINRVIQEVPENFLEDILSYLRNIEKRSKQDIEALSDLSGYSRRIRNYLKNSQNDQGGVGHCHS